MMNFAIALETDGTTVLLELVGEFDMTAVPTFEAVVSDHVKRGSRYFVLDLDRLQYIDSRGIYALIEMLRQVHNHRGDAAFVLTNSRIARVFALSGIERAFRFYADRAAALAWAWRAPACPADAVPV